NEGSTGTVSFSGPSDPSATDTAAGFHYAFDFDNNGSFEDGNGTYVGSATSASPTVPASFLADGPGTRTVRARIIDKDGGFTQYSTAVTINKANATFVVTPYAVTYDGSAHTATGTATGVGGVDLSAGLNLGATIHTNAGAYNGDAWTFSGGTNY